MTVSSIQNPELRLLSENPTLKPFHPLPSTPNAKPYTQCLGFGARAFPPHFPPLPSTPNTKPYSTFLGLLESSIVAVRSCLDHFDAATNEVAPNLRVGIIVFDASVHFLDLRKLPEDDLTPRDYIMTDIADPFVPHPFSVVPFFECKDALYHALDCLPQARAPSKNASSAPRGTCHVLMLLCYALVTFVTFAGRVLAHTRICKRT